MDWAILPVVAPFVLRGTAVTLELVACVLLIATPLALLVGVGRNSPSRWIAAPLGVASAFVRGVPPLLLLFGVYFLLPVFGVTLDPFPAAVLGLSLYAVFYFAECVRGGLASVPAAQRAAVRALAIPPWRGFVRVILPQALPAALPAYAGHATEVVKNSALAASIAVSETMGNAYQLILSTGRPLEILLFVAAIYAAIDLALLGLPRVLRPRWRVVRP